MLRFLGVFILFLLFLRIISPDGQKCFSLGGIPGLTSCYKVEVYKMDIE